ncbi:TetR/AcrR family transcriptional regulator [Flavobacterium sp. MFBS3-15]|uniref:TetR/AcrR family transcriptional regulator n=1 Tax=Flavobacterium sp. MFBS3-15 TaxID=2989816 RepID=UPI00223563B5|nr:TetR/AcrR family transcriptional regulator [Flavobacterium sp. MFBS3-15]MCW4469719.1 TetR/AcrR family transcriptional regulator [Flavobacterium sp. MFBS3-15]
MSAKATDQDTEKLIKETAMQVFFAEGRFNATTQEIADAAGVNRTLINYYFRSRDKLFEQVFEEAHKQEHELMEKIFYSDLPFKQKIARHLDVAFEQSQKYPYLEIYMVTQVNQGCNLKDHENMEELLKDFYKEIAAEMEKGTIEKMKPEQFALNFISLMSFPISMRPLLQDTMGFSNEEYDTLLSERKEIIMKTLFKQ